MPKSEEQVNLKDAYGTFADMLLGEDRAAYPKLSTFDDFVQSVFSLSYPRYDFKSWHIRLISQTVDEVLASIDPYLLAAMPRYHLKSTILSSAAHIFRMLTHFGDGMILSYKSELADYHCAEIKKAIRSNSILSKLCVDLSPQSDTLINYRVGNKQYKIYTSGIFAMKRGIHVSGLLTADDILGDIHNPLVFTELEKVQRLFESEVINIPNKECPLFVFGTTISDTDLLFKLKDNPLFKVIWLPALNPTSEHEVLWDRYDKEWLKKRRGKTSSEWRAFSTEFMLMPISATNAFISREDLDKVIDTNLKNHSIHMPYDKKDKHVVAGLDIGKRRSPSHLSVFTHDDDDNLIMLTQMFWDGVDYAKQVELVNTAIESFGIDTLYWDATRGELEDRNLNTRICIPIKFTGRGERNQTHYAVGFAKRIEARTIKLIDDDRFVSQITCLNSNLDAPDTPAGHADSFWSVALAVGAYEHRYARNRKKGTSDLGNLQDTINREKSDIGATKSKFEDYNAGKRCRYCNGTAFETLDNGMKRCLKCQILVD